MKTLLWKELRERRLWLIPLGASVIVPVLAKQGYTFAAEPLTVIPWVAPSLLIALLFGMGTYSGELAAGTMDFLHSRPLTWKQLLSAKLLAALTIMASSIILGAIVYRLTLPAPYASFATLPILGLRGAMALGAMVVVYVTGAACSAVLPGMVGAVLVFLTLTTGVGLEMAMISMLLQGSRDQIWPALAWWLGSISASVFVIRFGMTLSLPARVKRYALVLVMVVVLLVPFSVICRTRGEEESVSQERSGLESVSPTGRYAKTYTIGDLGTAKYADYKSYLVRLSDGRSVMLEAYGGFRWAGDTLYSVRREYRRSRLTGWNSPPGITPAERKARTLRFLTTPYYVYTCQMDRDGKLTEREASTGIVSLRDSARPSADGSLLLMAEAEVSKADLVRDQEAYKHAPTVLRVFDLDTMRLLPLAIHEVATERDSSGVATYWWESADEIGYIDTQGARHVVRVRPETTGG